MVEYFKYSVNKIFCLNYHTPMFENEVNKRFVPFPKILIKHWNNFEITE